MGLESILKTAWVIGQFFEPTDPQDAIDPEHVQRRNRLEEFKESGTPNLNYDVFVDHYGIGTKALGKLNSQNPFLRFFRPYSPPGGPVATNASEMAAQVVEGVPQLLKEMAGLLADFDADQKPLTKGLSDPEDPLSYSSFMEWYIGSETVEAIAEKWVLKDVDKNSLHQKREKLRKAIADQSDDGSAPQAEKLAQKANQARGLSSGVKTFMDPDSLFYVLIDKYVCDAVDREIGFAIREYRSKAKAKGIQAEDETTGGMLLNYEDDDARKARVILAIAKRDADCLDDQDYHVASGQSNEAKQIFKEWLKSYKGIAPAQSISGELAEKELDEFLKVKRGEWRSQHKEDISPMLELEVRAFWLGACGQRGVNEETVYAMVSQAIRAMVDCTAKEADARVAERRTEGAEFNRATASRWLSNNTPEAVKIKDVRQNAEQHFEEWAEAYRGAKGQEAKQLATLVNSLIYLASIDSDLRSRITSTLLLAENASSKLQTQIGSEDYAKVVDGWVREARERRKKARGVKSARQSEATLNADEESSKGGEKVKTTVSVARSTSAVQTHGSGGADFPTQGVPEGTSVEPSTTVAEEANVPSSAAAKDADTSGNPVEEAAPEGTSVEPSTTVAEEANVPSSPAAKDAGTPGNFNEQAAQVAEDVSKEALTIGTTANGLSPSNATSPGESTGESASETGVDAQLAFLDKILAEQESISAEVIKKFHKTLQKGFAALGKANEPNLKDSANTTSDLLQLSAQQYVLSVLLVRHGLAFGQRESAPLNWLLQMARYRTSARVLENEAISSFIDCGTAEDIKQHWDKVEKEFAEKVNRSIPLLSRLYGMEILLKSVSTVKDVRLMVWNGEVDKLINKLPELREFNPKNINDDAGRLPVCLYFTDQLAEAIEDLPENGFVGDNRPIPPCLMDAGPNYKDKASVWNQVDASSVSFVSLAGPAIRLRGLSNRTNPENNGLATSPLVPPGFIVLSAILEGRDISDLRQKDKTGENPLEMASLPESSEIKVAKTDRERIRFLLHHDVVTSTGIDCVQSARELLMWNKSKAAGDILVWVLKLIELNEMANVAVIAPGMGSEKDGQNSSRILFPRYASLSLKGLEKLTDKAEKIVVRVPSGATAKTLCVQKTDGTIAPLPLHPKTDAYLKLLFHVG